MDYKADEKTFLGALGRIIRKRRQERQWSQEVLAHESALSPRFISELENGRGNISVLRLRQVSRALGCALSELVDEPGAERIISLIGLRGAGKTAVGRVLAERLDLDFVELDDQIERMAGLSLSELFALHGEEYYRRLEFDVLSEFITRTEGGILATGGGLVTRRVTFDLLRRATATVWLQAEPHEHLARVAAQGDSRPMEGRTNPLEELESLLAERTPLYQEADFAVKTSGVSVERVAERILDFLETNQSRDDNTRAVSS